MKSLSDFCFRTIVKSMLGQQLWPGFWSLEQNNTNRPVTPWIQLIFFCQIDVWKSHSNIEKLSKALWLGVAKSQCSKYIMWQSLGGAGFCFSSAKSCCFIWCRFEKLPHHTKNFQTLAEKPWISNSMWESWSCKKDEQEKYWL